MNVSSSSSEESFGGSVGGIVTSTCVHNDMALFNSFALLKSIDWTPLISFPPPLLQLRMVP